MKKSIVILIAVLFTPVLWASTYYVREVKGVGFNYSDTAATKSLIESSVAHIAGDRVVTSSAAADYILQPELVRIGSAYILKIDKIQGSSLVYSSRADLKRLEDLSTLAPKVTRAVIEEHPLDQIAETPQEAAPAGISQAGHPATARIEAPLRYWSASLGPAFSNNLDSKNPMYNLAVGHVWEIHPQVGAKAQVQGAFSSGSEDSQFINLGVGALYFMDTDRKLPYLEGQMGYADAKSNNGNRAAGFSLGAAVGYQFLRNGNRSADAQLSYALLTTGVPGAGSPSVLGARFGMNF